MKSGEAAGSMLFPQLPQKFLDGVQGNDTDSESDFSD